jgi:hypothetical protein
MPHTSPYLTKVGVNFSTKEKALSDWKVVEV